MKLFTKIAGMVLAATIITGFNGCAGNLPNADAQEPDGFGLLADVGQAAEGHAGHFGGPMTGPGGHMGGPMGGPMGGHMGGPMGGPMMGMMMKDLNLTADQQAQFKTLFEQVRAGHQGQKPDFKALHDSIKQAFLADKFDAAGLKARLQQNLPAPGSRAPEMAANLIKAWQILTPEQQNKLTTRLEQMDQKMQQWQQNRGAAGQPGGPGAPGQQGPGEHLQQFAQQLQLTADQQNKLKALWQGNQPERQVHMQAFRQVKQQVLAELKSGKPSADRIAAIIAPMAQKGQQGMAQHLDKMGALHDILTPAQRQQLVTLMEQKIQQFRNQPGRGKWRHRQ